MAMMVPDLSFSASISSVKLPRYGASKSETFLVKRSPTFRAEARPAESGKYGTNGRATKMVPTTELRRTNGGGHVRLGTVNGSPNGAVNGSTKVSVNGSAKAIVNGSTKAVINGTPMVAVNGTSLVKSSKTASLVNMQKQMRPKDDPFQEELKILPSDEGFSWAKDNYNSMQRSIDIWSFVLALRVRVLFDNAKWAYPGGFSEEKQKVRRRKTASWLREQVLQLGPTFIKLGQLSSTRSDLFPREFVDELAKLQDRVPAFSPEKAKAFIEKEMGCSIDVVYKEFEERPIAAASLGQVHRAVLHNGERVAVKVQRPGLKKLFDIDLRNLKLVAEYFQRSETLGGPSRDWIGIYEECSKILYEEIDYINEGKNADRFRRDFRNIKWVRVPLIMWDYTTEKVLTLEYVPGIKINNLDVLDSRGYSRSLIASRAIESYLIQILKTGFFHADPHPGNLAVDKDGSLIYYDFGMMGEIRSFTRERLLSLFYSVYEKDANKVMKALIDLEALQPTGDLSPVRRSIQFFLDNLLSQTPDQQQTLAAIGEVVKAIEKAIPVRQALPVAAAAEIDPAMEDELKAMEAQKAEIDLAAAAQVRRELWCGLAYLVVQTAGFMRLTFWELSWDVMEPICFYVTSMYFMAGYAFFLRTKKEPSFEGFFESRFAAKQKRVMRARGFDVQRYEELRRACGVVPPARTTPCASAGAQESGHCPSYCHCH